MRARDLSGLQALDECRDEACWDVMLLFGAPKDGAPVRSRANSEVDDVGRSLAASPAKSSLTGGVSLAASQSLGGTWQTLANPTSTATGR